MRAHCLAILIACFVAGSLSAQAPVSGVVMDQDDRLLIGAQVYWVNGDGTLTNAEGRFEIASHTDGMHLLVARFVGYKADTLMVGPGYECTYYLHPLADLEAVEIVEQRDDVYISNLNAIKTETITQGELRKAACCDLAGCFETQTTVQPQVTNVITNAKELRILGLSGVYNQVLIDGLPMVQGLTYTYGLSGIPGTLVDNIHVSKGANSVVQGYESMVGQINVETKNPQTTDKLFLNGYINNFGERHLNANLSFKGAKWSNMTALHTVQPAGVVDRDGDRFMDLPRLTRYMVFNRTHYGDEQKTGLYSRINVRFMNEERIGGQVNFDPEQHLGGTEVYGQHVQIQQPDVSTRTGYRFNSRTQLVLQASAFSHKQEAWFGTVHFDAHQQNAYANVQVEHNYGETHSLKAGVSYRHLTLSETIAFSDRLDRTYDGRYVRVENIPGVFAENTLGLFKNRLTWIAGLRSDHHNLFGTITTPRSLVKYDLSERTSIRASAGFGWRTVNLFSENNLLMIGARDVVFTEELSPETSVNYGANFTHTFSGEKASGFFTVDFYRTVFGNQVFPDYDADSGLAVVGNFTGTAISEGFQAEASVKLFKRLQVKTGYNFLNVYREENGVRTALPFNAMHKVVNTFSYAPLTEKWHFDANIHSYGRQRLPSTQANPEPFQRPDFSDPYTVVSAQLTAVFGRFEVYSGVENIFDFRQLQPILSWEDPFSRYFDTSSVWGPTRGREIYLGLRFKV
ncbi:MAG: carboxypeptidase-like regulatory domain-containing protein [Flavobacteriales bacterium]